MNTESPDSTNTGTRVSNPGVTGLAQYSPEIGAETTNDAGVDIGRIIVTGKGALYERYLDESQLVTEAGVTGAIGTFDVVNNGVQKARWLETDSWGNRTSKVRSPRRQEGRRVCRCPHLRSCRRRPHLQEGRRSALAATAS